MTTATYNFSNEYEASNRLKKIGRQIASMKAAAEADPVAALDREQELLDLQAEQKSVAVWIKQGREKDIERKLKTAQSKLVQRDKALSEIEALLQMLEAEIGALKKIADIHQELRQVGARALAANAYVERNLQGEAKALNFLTAHSLEWIIRQATVQAFGAGPFLNMRGAEHLECVEFDITNATNRIRQQIGD